MAERLAPRENIVTWTQLQERLKGAGVPVSRATIRKYQQMGTIPPPQAYGRQGSGPGVDWGWTEQQAQVVVEKVQEVAVKRKAPRRLQRLARKQAYDWMIRLFNPPSGPWPEGLDISIMFAGVKGQSLNVGRALIQMGLENLDNSITDKGVVLLAFVPYDEETSAPAVEPSASKETAD